MFPWFNLVRGSWLAGHIPLWNQFAFGGSALLGNGQSAALSVFTAVALPFPASMGMSVSMLARMVVAGLGTFLFVRQLGAGSRAALFAGVAFGASAFIVDWLGWPLAAVAALVPFGFAAAERFVRAGSERDVGLLALAIGLQFLGGHIETSIHFVGSMAIYAVVRAVFAPRPVARVLGLAVAGVLGLLVAAVALLPLYSEIGGTGIVDFRAATSFGQSHLQPEMLLNWLVPNRAGNPALDAGNGPVPNYNEAVGFATVAALVLAPLGAYWLWRRARAAAAGLVAIGLLAGLIVYGPLAGVAGSLPVLSVTLNTRLLVVPCFVVAVLGGLGVQQLEDRRRDHPGIAGYAAAVVGAAATAGLAALAYVLFFQRGQVSAMFPQLPAPGFWTAAAGLAGLAALAFALAAAGRGASRVAVLGVTLVAVLEAAMFAGPNNPLVDPADVPPASVAMDQLRQVAAGRTVAAVQTAIPETLSLYQVHDAAGYDAVYPARVRMFWQRADEAYTVPDDHHVVLSRPRPGWLVAAGVGYILAPAKAPAAGGVEVARVGSVAVQQVSSARPFAYAANSVRTAPDAEAAVGMLAADPGGAVVAEGCCVGPAEGAEAAARQPAVALPLHRDYAEKISGDIVLDRDSLVVVAQTYSPDWVARVDGHPVPTHPANVMLESFEALSGRHHVELTYEPASFSVGVALSAVGAVGVVALLALPLMVGRRRAVGRIRPILEGTT